VDVYAESGGLYCALIRSALVQVTSGQMVINFIAQVENPAVKGIEIIPSVPPTATNTPTFTDTPIPTNTPTSTPSDTPTFTYTPHPTQPPPPHSTNPPPDTPPTTPTR